MQVTCYSTRIPVSVVSMILYVRDYATLCEFKSFKATGGSVEHTALPHHIPPSWGTGGIPPPCLSLWALSYAIIVLHVCSVGVYSYVAE